MFIALCLVLFLFDRVQSLGVFFCVTLTSWTQLLSWQIVVQASGGCFCVMKWKMITHAFMNRCRPIYLYWPLAQICHMHAHANALYTHVCLLTLILSLTSIHIMHACARAHTHTLTPTHHAVLVYFTCFLVCCFLGMCFQDFLSLPHISLLSFIIFMSFAFVLAQSTSENSSSGKPLVKW